MGTATAIHNLYRPLRAETGWQDLVNANCDVLDLTMVAGGETAGVNRLFGNLDAFSLGFVTSGINRLGISAAGAVTMPISLNIGASTTVTGVIDDDSMGTASASRLASSESIVAFSNAGDATVLATALAAIAAAATPNHSDLVLDDGTNPHSTTKADVGLGSVENTQLSTWAGSANITTVGTLGTLRVDGLTQLAYEAGANITMFENATDGKNPTLTLYGYDSGAVAIKSMTMQVNAAGQAVISNSVGEALSIDSGDGLRLNGSSNGGISCFASAASGDNDLILIYGYVTAGAGPRYGYLQVENTNDEFIIGVEANANIEGMTFKLTEVNQHVRARNTAGAVIFDITDVGNMTIGAAGVGVDYTLTFHGENSDGIITWDEGLAVFGFDHAVSVTGDLTGTTVYGDGSNLTGVGAAAASALTVSAKVNEGAGISKGQAVYVSGATGQVPQVSLCDNTDSAKYEFLGLAAETKADGQNILIRVGGELTGVDTDGTGVPGTTETWADGDPLYMSTAGNLTDTIPTSGTVQHVCTVEYAHGSNGKILVHIHPEPYIAVPSGVDLDLRMGDDVGVNKVSFENYSDVEVASVNSLGIAAFKGLGVTQDVATSGSPTAATVTGGAHTTLAASTEATDILFDLGRTVEFATGALTEQKAFSVLAPTYAFVGASVIDDAATVHIANAPQAGANATITNAMALWVEAGLSRLGGNLTVGGTAALAGRLSLTENGTNQLFSFEGAVADDGSVDLPDATSGFAWITFDEGAAWAFINFTDGAVVTGIENDGLVEYTDLDANYCIFDNGTQVRVRNRIGAQKNIKIFAVCN